MNDQQAVANALRCLQIIKEHPAESHEISQATGLPFTTCAQLLQRMHHAGLIDINDEGRFLLERPIDELSPLDILDAVWETFIDALPLRMLFGPAERTQRAVAVAQRTNRYMSDGGLA